MHDSPVADGAGSEVTYGSIDRLVVGGGNDESVMEKDDIIGEEETVDGRQVGRISIPMNLTSAT